MTEEVKKFKIGIVGHGFVGKAVDYGFTNPLVEKFYVDPNYGTTIDDLIEWEPDLSFICAPTPMMDNGAIDATIVQDAVLKLVSHTPGAVIIKSTVTPQIIQNLWTTLHFREFDNRVVYNPEFLTEKSALADFVEGENHIFGGTPEAVAGALWAYDMFSLCNLKNVHKTGPLEASLIKYSLNTYLAMKVTYFNQLYDICEKYGASFNNVVNGIRKDDRIGNTHMAVPGFDGKRGFGGACFPKDTLALVRENKEFTLLEEVVKINNEYRNQYELDDREIAQNVNYEQAKKEQ